MISAKKLAGTLYYYTETMVTKRYWIDWTLRSRETSKGPFSASPCKNALVLINCSLGKIETSQEAGWHSFLLYLDHGNKETLNWLDIMKQRNLVKNGAIYSATPCENALDLTNCSYRKNDISQETGWHFLLLYLDHGSKEYWLDWTLRSRET